MVTREMHEDEKKTRSSFMDKEQRQHIVMGHSLIDTLVDVVFFSFHFCIAFHFTRFSPAHHAWK